MSSTDPIETFIKSNRKFSISLLVNSHSRLGILQMSKGGLTFEDVLQSLYSQGQALNGIEINAHSMLILGILVPALTNKGQIKLQIPREIVSSESAFIKSILNLIYQKCNNVEYPFVEEFKNESMLYLQNKSSGSGKFSEPLGSGGNGQPFVTASAESPRPLSGELSVNNVRRNSHTNLALAGLYADCDLPDDHKAAANRIEFEKSEPIVRLLAQVRKVGMDILFPQSTHDKILACIFVAIRSSSTPAHRELIDMVMAVKESNKISQLEHVSKTKVRGVLALLKHGDLLITQGAEGEPVRLYLAPGIETYKDLREKHDIFLGRYMLEHHLFIPAILKSELTWQFEEDVKTQRLETLNKLVTQLQHFYTSYIAYQEKIAAEGGGADENGNQASVTSSEDGGSSAPLISSASASTANSVVGDGEWNYVRPQSLPVQKTTKQPTASEQYLENRPKSLGTYQQQQQQQYAQQQRGGGGYSSAFLPNNLGNSYGAGSSYQSMLQQRQQAAQFQQHQQMQQQQQQQQQFQQQQRGYSTGDLQAEYRMYGALNGLGMQAPSNNQYRGGGGNTFQNPAFKASAMGGGGLRSPYGSHHNNGGVGGSGYNIWQQQQQQGPGGVAGAGLIGMNKYDNVPAGYGGMPTQNYLSPSQYHHEPQDFNVGYPGDDLRGAAMPQVPSQQAMHHNLHYSGTFQPQSSVGDMKYGAYNKLPSPPKPYQQEQMQQQQQQQQQGGYQAGMRTSFARGSVTLDPQQLSPTPSAPNSQSTQQAQWSPNSANSLSSKVLGSTPVARVGGSDFVGNIDHVAAGPVSFVGISAPAEDEFNLSNMKATVEELANPQAHSRRSSSQSTHSSRRSSNYSNADSRRSSRLIENVTLDGDEDENTPVVELGDYATDVLAEDRGAELDWSEFGVSLSSARAAGASNRVGVRLSGKVNLLDLATAAGGSTSNDLSA